MINIRTSSAAFGSVVLVYFNHDALKEALTYESSGLNLYCKVNYVKLMCSSDSAFEEEDDESKGSGHKCGRIH